MLWNRFFGLSQWFFFVVFNHNPFQLSLTKLSVTTDRHLTFDTIKRENMLIYEIKREKKIIVSWVKFSECALFTWWVALRLAYGSVSQDPTIAAAAAAAAALLQSPSDSVRPHRRQPTRLPRPWGSPGKNTGVGCHFLLQCMKLRSESEVAQSCPTLRDPMDCSPPGSSVHGTFQARIERALQ